MFGRPYCQKKNASHHQKERTGSHHKLYKIKNNMTMDQLPGERDPMDLHWVHLKEQVLIVEAELVNLHLSHSLGLGQQEELQLAQGCPK